MGKWGDIGKIVKFFNFKRIRTKDLMYNIVNNAVLYNCNLMGVELKHSHQETGRFKLKK